MIDEKLEKELRQILEYKAIANAIEIITVMCAGNSEKVVDLLTNYLWDESEAAGIKKAITGDYDAMRDELFMKSAREYRKA